MSEFESALRRIVREEMRAVVTEEMKKAPPSSSTEERLTIKEAAMIAKVSEKTVRNWLSADHLTTYHAGRQLRVDRAQLDAFMAAGPKRSTEDDTPERLAILAFRRQAG